MVALHQRPFPPSSPFPGLVEFDAAGMAAAVLDVARAGTGRGRPGHRGGDHRPARQHARDRATGEPLGPGLGWQDLRTVLDCITAKAEHGLNLAPNQSATKAKWLLDQHDP